MTGTSEAPVKTGTSGRNRILRTLGAAGDCYAFQCAPPANAMASRELRAIAMRLTSFMLCPPPKSAPPPSGGQGGLSGDTQPGDKPDIRST